MSGERVFITGGTRGVGEQMDIGFAAEGFNVAVGYGSDEKAAQVVLAGLNETNSDGTHIGAIGTFVLVLGFLFGCRDTIQLTVFDVLHSCLGVA